MEISKTSSQDFSFATATHLKVRQDQILYYSWVGRCDHQWISSNHPHLQRKVENAQERLIENHSIKVSHLRTLEPGEFWSRCKEFWSVNNFGPDAKKTPWLTGQIVSFQGSRAFQVQLSDGRMVRRHLNHLRRRSASRQPLTEFDWSTTLPDEPASEPAVIGHDSLPDPSPGTACNSTSSPIYCQKSKTS